MVPTRKRTLSLMTTAGVPTGEVLPEMGELPLGTVRHHCTDHFRLLSGTCGQKDEKFRMNDDSLVSIQDEVSHTNSSRIIWMKSFSKRRGAPSRRPKAVSGLTRKSPHATCKDTKELN